MQTWLEKSYLTQINDRSCVLAVEKNSYHIVNTLPYLSQIYPVVQQIYPDVTSLYVTHNNFIALVKSGKIDIYSVEVKSDRNQF